MKKILAFLLIFMLVGMNCSMSKATSYADKIIKDTIDKVSSDEILNEPFWWEDYLTYFCTRANSFGITITFEPFGLNEYDEILLPYYLTGAILTTNKITREVYSAIVPDRDMYGNADVAMCFIAALEYDLWEDRKSEISNEKRVTLKAKDIYVILLEEGLYVGKNYSFSHHNGFITAFLRNHYYKTDALALKVEYSTKTLHNEEIVKYNKLIEQFQRDEQIRKQKRKALYHKHKGFFYWVLAL